MKIIKLFAYLLVVILSADLLYLYYSGAWCDPIKAIEYSEVACLYLFAVGGLVLFITEVRKL